MAIPFVTLVALTVGSLVGYLLGVSEGNANEYAALGLEHTRAALVWHGVRSGALLGALGGFAFACAAGAVWPKSQSLGRRLVFALAACVAGVLLYLAHDVLMLGPALHASRLLRDPAAWLGIGLVVALACMPWSGAVGPRVLTVLALASIAPLAAARIDLARTAPATAPHRPNVVIVLLDALRADPLEAYGYRRETSPFVSALAADGILFERAFAPANLTRMSVPSFLGSVHAATHGIRHRDDQAPPALLLLPEVLRAAGYQTAAWMPNPSLAQRYRFYYGFDAYYDDDRIPVRSKEKHLPLHERWETAQAINRSALAWVHARDRDRPVFLYLHYRDIHGPYAPPPPYDTRWTPPEPARPFPRGVFRESDHAYLKLPNHRDDVGCYEAQYDGCIRYTSDRLTELFAALREDGVLDDAIVVLMADHGEAFLEHGTLNHGNVLFDELVHVPLVVRPPDGAPRGRRVPALVSLIDVPPTILDYVGLPAPARFPGRSLRPFIDGTAESAGDVVFFEAPDAVGARTSRWKVIIDRATGTPELYDVQADPAERHALPPAEWPPDASALVQRLRAHGPAHERLLAGGASTPLGEDQRRKLEALGYVE
jgi:arylsulfatase